MSYKGFHIAVLPLCHVRYILPSANEQVMPPIF